MPNRSRYLIALALAGASTLGLAAENRKTVTAEQAISCIKLAVAARAGEVKELEVDIEKDRKVCEVEIVGANGRKSDVYVDVAANKVLRVDD